MSEEQASANVNRCYTLTASSIAIFTFLMFFLFPRYQAGTLNTWLFQATLVVMGLSIFSFVFASFYYYCCSLGSRFEATERARLSVHADRMWVFGYSLLVLAPTLVLFTVGLMIVGYVFAATYLAYLVFMLVNFPNVLARAKE